MQARRDETKRAGSASAVVKGSANLIKISVTRSRAKVANVRRDPRVALQVMDGFSDYLAVDGAASFLEDDLLPRLRRLYEQIRGAPRPNWQEYDEAVVHDGRLIPAIRPERYYPLIR